MRIVIKVGTSTLTYPTGRMDIRHVETLCKVLSDVKNAGHEIVLVSSGAIGMGVGKLNLRERPTDMATKQAAAAVGQCELMYVYDQLFGTYNHTIAQILLTGEDLRDENRHRNFSNTVERLLDLNVLPVINENDTVSTVVKADMLMILSDIDGLYTADPRRERSAELIAEVREITPQMRESAGGGGTALSTGGMTTKLTAAGICMEAGTDMYILNGAQPLLIYEVLEGKSVGTRFIGRKTP